MPLQRRLLQVQPAPDQSDRALRIRQLRQPAGGESPLLPELRKEVKAPRKKFPRRASVPGWAAGEFWRRGHPSAQGDVAGGQAADQGVHALPHLDAVHPQLEGRLDVGAAVVDENALGGLEVVFFQKGLVDPGVGLVDVDLAGGDPPVELVQQPLLPQEGQGVLGHIGEVIDAVAVALQPAHQVQHPPPDPENAHPVVQHLLHLEQTALGFGVFQHLLVALEPGDQPRVQLGPGLAAEGQPVDLLLGGFVAEPLHQVILGVKIHHDPAKIKNNIF